MGHPVKIALLTDIHIGPSIGKSRVEKIVKMTNELNPGDYHIYLKYMYIYRY